ncbi:MAG: hypothetical protein AAF433_12800 [Bacteroidota bacterium]
MRSFAVLFLSLTIQLSLFAETVETRHIHVIKVLDSHSPNAVIVDGCRSIEYGLDQEVQLMRDHLGITDIHYYDVSGLDFRRSRLEEVLTHEIQYQERDIIVLVYAGHGYREASSVTPYPKLYFNGYDSAIEFEELRMRLIDMNPSMLINMIVACNVTQYDMNRPPDYQADGNAPPIASLSIKAPRRDEPYMQLFADQTGYTKVVDLISAKPERFTFLTRDGGIFFSEILYTFMEIFTDLNLRNWDQVCQNIEQRTFLRSQEQGLNQHPLCRYNIFMSTSRSPEVLAAAAPNSGRNCVLAVRQLRRDQRVFLKELRRKHRREMQAMRANRAERSQRRLVIARQRRERAEMMEEHEQNYQRSLQACR